MTVFAEAWQREKREILDLASADAAVLANH